MRYPSRLDHDLFELTTELCAKFLNHNVANNPSDEHTLQQWCDLVDEGACLDEPFALQYISPSQHRKRRCIEITALELMLICWPWQTLAVGLQHITETKPLDEVVFARLSALAMNNENEWHHFGAPGTFEQDTQYHVMYGVSRWCLGYEQRKPAFSPKMGFWEVIGLREQLDFASENALQIIEGLVPSLHILSARGFEKMLEQVEHGLFDKTYGTRFGSLLAVLVQPPGEKFYIKQQNLQQQLLANGINSRVKSEASVLTNAPELAERARVAQGIKIKNTSNKKRKI